MLQLFVALTFFLPLLTFAQDFVPLVGIPFMEQPEDATATAMLSAYANAFYIAAISLGAVVAVLKIIFAGVKYMLTDIVTDKSQAKTDIKGALLGLILIIGAVLILETISTDITSLRAFNLNALTIVAPEPEQSSADQCPDGQDFVVTNDDPDGHCVHSIEIADDQDYRDSPGEGQAQCGATQVYNAETNRCDTVTDVVQIPDERITTWLDESGGDQTIFASLGRTYCQSAYGTDAPVFDPVTRTCTPHGAQ
jgi:hypothetical protein